MENSSMLVPRPAIPSVPSAGRGERPAEPPAAAADGSDPLPPDARRALLAWAELRGWLADMQYH